MEPWLCEPHAFSFVNLTSERHRVFRLIETETPCFGSAAGNVITRSLSFWELRGTRMQQIFTEVLLQSLLSLSGPESSKTLKARVRLVGGAFPRQLAVTDSISERFSEEPDTVRHRRYRYDEAAGKYGPARGEQ
jgi:hypothetical protein